MKVKKLLPVVMAGVLGVAVLSGCAGEEKSKDTNVTETQVANSGDVKGKEASENKEVTSEEGSDSSQNESALEALKDLFGVEESSSEEMNVENDAGEIVNFVDWDRLEEPVIQKFPNNLGNNLKYMYTDEDNLSYNEVTYNSGVGELHFSWVGSGNIGKHIEEIQGSIYLSNANASGAIGVYAQTTENTNYEEMDEDNIETFAQILSPAGNVKVLSSQKNSKEISFILEIADPKAIRLASVHVDLKKHVVLTVIFNGMSPAYNYDKALELINSVRYQSGGNI